MKNRYAAVLWVATTLPLFALQAQEAPPSGGHAASSSEAAPSWTLDQAVTCSVHEAWVLGGKTESGFFAIVKDLAALSAQKRGLTLPNSETVGREFGEYIKKQAREDRDQLLYEIVDRAVRKYGTKPAA
jgi:hypothetical protein